MLAKYRLQIIDNFKLTESMKKALAKNISACICWESRLLSTDEGLVSITLRSVAHT